MKKLTVNQLLIAVVAMILSVSVSAETDLNTLSLILNDEYRSESARAKDSTQKPLSTLTYFGIEPDMQVMELWPSDGWYTEILAPYLKLNGQLTTALYDPEKQSQDTKIFELANFALKSRLLVSQQWYGDVGYFKYEPSAARLGIQTESQDMILSFNDSIKWVSEDSIRTVFEDVFFTLRPGGIFGLVDNVELLPKDNDLDAGRYPSLLVSLAEEVGFKLVGSNNVTTLTPQIGLLAAYEHESNSYEEVETALTDDLNSVASSVVNSKHFVLKFVKIVKVGTLVESNGGVLSSTLAGSQSQR